MISSILIFILVLSVLILVHEVGHFFAAKKSGLWVEEFGFGIPPRIFGKKIGETIYSINLLPFGGFVKIHGQNETEKIDLPDRAFYKKSKKTRAFIVVAGILMNLLLGIFCFAFVYTFSGIPRETPDVKIIEVNSDSPAQKSGILAEDVIKKVGGVEISSTKTFIEEIAKYKNKRVEVVVERGKGDAKSQKELQVSPRSDYPKDEGPLGVVITQTEIYFPPLWQRPFLGVYYGTKEAIFWGKTIALGVFDMIAGLFVGEVPKDVSGPVGIFAVTSEVAKVGVLSLINFVGILSINLAILNILPFPALDGGVLFFILIEAVIGKKIVPKVENLIQNVGMVVLILLLLLITFYDIKRLIVAGSIDNFLNSFAK